MNDWTGNIIAPFSTIGASNHSKEDRAELDYYATDPKTLDLLLERETFSPYVWECACGGGHLSSVLKNHGYKVKSSDIVDRGYDGTEITDFLKVTKEDIKNDFPRDIITNPPYKYAKEFVEHSIELVSESGKIAMFLKLTFWEGKARRELFEKYPPSKIYVFSQRVTCAKNGIFEDAPTSAVCYAWFIWEKGFKGEPIVKWI